MERWNREEIERMQGTPWEPIPGREGIILKTAIHLPTRDEPPTEILRGENREPIKRRIKLNKHDINKYGMAQGVGDVKGLIGEEQRLITARNAENAVRENYSRRGTRGWNSLLRDSRTTFKSE